MDALEFILFSGTVMSVVGLIGKWLFARENARLDRRYGRVK